MYDDGVAVEIDLFRFLFFLTTFILSYANCSLPFRNIPVRGSAQVPSALASEPEQIIPTVAVSKILRRVESLTFRDDVTAWACIM